MRRRLFAANRTAVSRGRVPQQRQQFQPRCKNHVRRRLRVGSVGQAGNASRQEVEGLHMPLLLRKEVAHGAQETGALIYPKKFISDTLERAQSLHADDGVEAASRVQANPHEAEWFEAPAGLGLRPPCSLGDHADASAIAGIEGQNSIGLSVTHRADDESISG